MKKQKILITGGAGFIGFHLAKKLEKLGFEIVILDNFSRGKFDKEFKKLIKSKNINFKKASFENEIKIKKNNFDYIYHLAAIVGVNNVIKQPSLVLEKNIKLLISCIKFAKKQKKLKRFFFLSTSEIYAGTLKKKLLKFPTKEGSILCLDDLSEDRSTYMLSKIYGEALTHFSDLPYTILRPHNIFGPRMGMSHVIPEIIKKLISNNKFIKVQNPKHTRAFCYIDDAVDMIIKIMNTKKTVNKTYNLGDPRREIKIDNLVKKISKIIKSNKKFIFIRENLQKSPHRRIPSMHKLFSHINFKFKSSFDQSLSSTIQWYKNHYTFK